jgi:phenylacetate-CoA ligase
MMPTGLGSRIHSSLPGVVWPAIPPPAGQAMLAAQFQFDRSQWWPADELLAQQFRQLRLLIAHAVENVPHYRNHLAHCGVSKPEDITPDIFLRWPLLGKRAVQAEPARFEATALPPGHGEMRLVVTSGSSGQPLRAATSDASVFVQHALVMRSHLWYGFDLRAKFAAIRASIDAPVAPDWGVPDNAVFRTGPLVMHSAFDDHDAQLDWLLREQPAYLLAHNTNLRALLEKSRHRRAAPHSLRAVMGFGDMAAPDTAELARNLWGAAFYDTYSASEVGTIALQCPAHPHLHVQGEHVYLEVLRADDSPCVPGETGRVVITDLQNFAMPLIRYELGDYATVGPPCPCGRGLPVLKGVVGRAGHLAVDPTGRTFFAHLNLGFWTTAAPIQQRQIVQLTASRLEVRYVAERDLAGDECATLTRELRAAMRYDYEIGFTRMAHIPRGAGGKFDDFLSLLPKQIA